MVRGRTRWDLNTGTLRTTHAGTPIAFRVRHLNHSVTLSGISKLLPTPYYTNRSRGSPSALLVPPGGLGLGGRKPRYYAPRVDGMRTKTITQACGCVGGKGEKKRMVASFRSLRVIRRFAGPKSCPEMIEESATIGNRTVSPGASGARTTPVWENKKRKEKRGETVSQREWERKKKRRVCNNRESQGLRPPSDLISGLWHAE